MAEGFEWDDANILHIARHGITPGEVEEAASDIYILAENAYSVGGEDRWAVVGATLAGRLLFVVLTRRGERLRTVTARDTRRSERAEYLAALVEKRK